MNSLSNAAFAFLAASNCPECMGDGFVSQVEDLGGYWGYAFSYPCDCIMERLTHKQEYFERPELDSRTQADDNALFAYLSNVL